MFFNEKDPPPPLRRLGLGMGMENIFANIQGLSIEKRRGYILTFFVRKISKISYFLKRLGFSVGSSFFARFCSKLNTGRSDLRYFARKIYRHALEYVQPDGAKCGAILFFAPAGKKPECIRKS